MTGEPDLPDLRPFPDDWERALGVMAHPDDMEYGGAAAVAAWTAAGKQVAYLLVTKGEAGIDSMEPGQAAEVREAEQRASAAVVGVDVVEFLDHPDGTIEYGLALRRDLAAAIRLHRPELRGGGQPPRDLPRRPLNMADHRIVGQATIDAVRDAANRWVFPELAEDGHGGVGRRPPPRRGRLARPTHAVDVTATFDAGVESLRLHAAYLAGLGDPDPEAFLRGAAEATAARFGGRLAVSFELLGA